jgi:hypothetical protein
MNNNGTEAEFERFPDFDEEPDEELLVTLDDDARAELDELLGLQVLGLELWEGAEEEEGQEQTPPEEQEVFDCDLFLEDGLALELYAAMAYPDPDSGPTRGIDDIFEVVGKLVDDELTLMDYDQADEEGGLALAFGTEDEIRLVLTASAWAVSEWEPDELAGKEEGA